MAEGEGRQPRPARPEDGLAWITGASSGIGRQLALELVRRGWTVAVTARRAEELARLAAEAPAGRILPAPADVTEPEAVAQAVREVETRGGRPIALAVLNAGTYLPDSAEGFDLAAFTLQVKVNVLGTANALAAVMPAMIARRGGQVAIVSSVAGYRGLPRAIAYGATKAALIAMSESLKFDLDRTGVMINLVNPGFVKTPLTDKNDFPMPFLIPVERAAERIADGLARGRFEIAFPWRFVAILKTLRVLPYALYFPLVGLTTGRR
ncbi:SDR family NAD(P)-dependent oxidoreductase [Elioraea thermophila]|uniref:SDR family NAD(P)-dependent oxidoreductase n=1 Tax=Elioraea thermophila TaxID=2185104 RepID=UPI000DF23559|nr:SDR family NAD(P)-dependent oxidoreductase [Elioraea thermophila]